MSVSCTPAKRGFPRDRLKNSYDRECHDRSLQEGTAREAILYRPSHQEGPSRSAHFRPCVRERTFSALCLRPVRAHIQGGLGGSREPKVRNDGPHIARGLRNL